MTNYYQNQNYVCEDSNNSIIYDIKCDLISKSIYKEKTFFYIEEKPINENQEFINNINIKIGFLSKDIYINKIEKILYIFEKILNNEKNEEKLFDSIKNLAKDDNLNYEFFIPPNDIISLNEKVKHNLNIKSQVEENIRKINKSISKSIIKSCEINKKYEEYMKKMNDSIKINPNINTKYSLQKMNKDELNQNNFY